MKVLLLLAAVAVISAVPLRAQVDLLSFGSSTYVIDPGSTAVLTQDATGITMNTTPGLGDTWYNSSMTPVTSSNWSAFPQFALRMTAPTNPGLSYSVTLFDASFDTINIYDGSTVGLTATPSLSLLSLNTPGSGNLSSVQYVQFTWGGGGSAINATATTFVGVPEPSTYALLAMCGLALGGYVMRRRQRA
jgi:hypothetical protein